MSAAEPDPIARATIADVERDCGLAADTLRVWERRYGFPTPERNARGVRVYPPDQVEKLRILSRLIRAGHRPNQVVGLGLEALKSMSSAPAGRRKRANKSSRPAPPADVVECLRILKTHDASRLSEALTRRMMHDGLAAFVQDFAAPLVTAVGESWAEGELELFEEHLCTEELTRALRFGISSAAGRQSLQTSRPKVLLTTTPGERHTLGLLMAEALMVLAGCRCVALGAETPARDILVAADAHDVDIIALSFSSSSSPKSVRDALTALTFASPRAEIWIGGAHGSAESGKTPGVRPLNALSDIALEVDEWRERRRLGPE